MILVCSSCKSSYLVPATVFAAGPRRVRCARCGHTWQADLPPKVTAVLAAMTAPEERFASSEASVANLSKESTDSPERVSKVLPPIPPGSNLPVLRKQSPWKSLRFWSLAIATPLLFVLVLGLVWRAPAFKIPWLEGNSTSKAMEMAERAKKSGFSLQKVRSERRFEDGGMQLAVEGEIRNDGTEAQPVPDILMIAIGSDGNEIQHWQIGAPVAKLPGGASVSFQYATIAPERTVVEVNLSFIVKPPSE